MVRSKHTGKCVHCTTRNVSRGRGLCHACYYNGLVRSMYRAPIDKVSWTDRSMPRAEIPYLPTESPPGTTGKVDAMVLRFKARLPLFHPDDAKDMSGAVPLMLLEVLKHHESYTRSEPTAGREYDKAVHTHHGDRQ